MDDLGAHRRRLVETIRRVAQWRDQKAGGYRAAGEESSAAENSRITAALERLAAFVSELEADDPALRCLMACPHTRDGAALMLGPSASRMLSRVTIDRADAEGDLELTEPEMRDLLRRLDRVEARDRRPQGRSA